MSHRKNPITAKGGPGQALTEFALIFSVALLLIFTIIDFGWIIFNYSQLYNALYQGLRAGSVGNFDAANPQHYQCDEIRQHIIDLATSSGVKASNIVIKYDDGRPLGEPERAGVRLGQCSASPGGVYVPNPAYVPPDGRTVLGSGVQPGDRIYIEINLRVPFLTPVLRAFVPGGIAVQLRAARSILPTSVPATTS